MIYIKQTASERKPELEKMIDQIRRSGISYRSFQYDFELRDLIINDLTVLLTERFELSLDTDNNAIDADKLNENFPIPPVPLIGREDAVNDVLHFLHKPNIRLITISGTGGIGKTRLGLEVLRRMKVQDHLKVCFVELGSIDHCQKVANAILRTAFPASSTPLVAEQMLIDLIGDKRILLLLDNFEHLIQSRLLISRLLENCPQLKILVTSRELLHISGEFEYALQPLPYVSDNRDSNIQLDKSPAIELFLQRARAIHPNFELSENNYKAIGDICNVLDGIPFAIELAASRTRLLTPEKILGLLKESLNFLKSDNYDTPARHQTLKSTVDWSFKLLNEEEQKLLCILSVFSVGATLEAAAMLSHHSGKLDEVWPFPRRGIYSYSSDIPQITNQISEIDFLESVESILSKSLSYTSVNKFGVLRINFYYTIRFYCQQKLKDSGLSEEVSYRHLCYYLFLTEKAWPKLKSEDTRETYELLDNDIPNIEAAMQWSMKDHPVLGLRIAIAMAEYWDTRGQYRETKKWIEDFLFVLPDLATSHFKLSAIARLELSRSLFRLADFEGAWSILDNCLQEARSRGEEYLIADAIILQTLINVYAHPNEEKEVLIAEGLSLTRALGYEMALLDAIQHKAADRIFSGQVTEGIPLALESLDLSKKLKAKRWEAISNIFLGFGYFMSGDYMSSKLHFLKALECTSDLSDQLLPVYSLLGLSQNTLVMQEIRMTGLLLGAVDTFIKKPGTTLVPIVIQIHGSLLEQIKNLPQLDISLFMDEGRRMRLGEVIDIVMKNEQVHIAKQQIPYGSMNN